MFFPTSLWGFCFLACIPPAVVRRRPPSSAAALSHTHITKLISSYTSHVTSYTTHPTSHTTHLTHNSSHTTLISHTHTHTSQNLSHHTQVISHHTQLIPHTTHLTHNSSHRQCVAGAVRRAAWRRCGADSRRRGRGSLLRGRRSTQSLLQKLGRGLSPAGPRLLCAWQAQYSEPPEGAAARIVAGWAAALLCVAGAVHRGSWRSWSADCRRLGRGFSLRGRRSTQSLLKELRRGLSPAGPRLLSARQAQYTAPSEGAAARIVAGWAAALLCVAGAVHRASRRRCGADCRRLGRGFSLPGRHSTQSRSCGADCRRLGRGFSLRGRRSTQRLLKELGRGLSPAGPRLLSAWQAQYTEPSEGAAARIVAGWAAALLCVAGAVHRASWRSWGADCRRLGRVAGWAAPSLCVAGAVHRAFWRSCGADCRRLGRGPPLRGRRSTQSLPKELRRGLSPAGPRLSFAWQAQYTEPPQRFVARIVAGWAAALCCAAGAVHRASFRSWVADCRRLGRGFSLRGRRSTQSLLKELVAGAHTHTHTHTRAHNTYKHNLHRVCHCVGSFHVIPCHSFSFLWCDFSMVVSWAELSLVNSVDPQRLIAAVLVSICYITTSTRLEAQANSFERLLVLEQWCWRCHSDCWLTVCFALFCWW